LETQFLLSGDINYVNKENLKALKDDTREVERTRIILERLNVCSKR